MRSYNVSKNEHILHVYRQSKIIFLKPVALFSFLTIFPWYFFITKEIQELRGYLWLWTLGLVLYVLREIALWNVNRYVITNKRLIVIKHEEVFDKTVVETPLDRILNISFKTTGLHSVMGGFGDVEVQVIGLMDPIILRNIHNPARIKDYLWHVHNKSLELTNNKSEIPDLQRHIGYTKRNQKII